MSWSPWLPRPRRSAPLVLLCLAAGASLGWTVDDPAAEILDPLPIDRRFRFGLRLSVAAALAMVVVLSTAAFLAIVGPGLPAGSAGRLPETAVGPGAVTAGLLVPGLVAALAFRWPDTLPNFTMNHVHHRWWWLAAIGGALAIHLASSESA